MKKDMQLFLSLMETITTFFIEKIKDSQINFNLLDKFNMIETYM